MSKLKYANGNKPLKEHWKNDPNSEDTPIRVAKAFVNDLAEGVYSDPPKITAFDNIDKYDGIVFQGNIKVNTVINVKIILNFFIYL